MNLNQFGHGLNQGKYLEEGPSWDQVGTRLELSDLNNQLVVQMSEKSICFIQVCQFHPFSYKGAA